MRGEDHILGECLGGLCVLADAGQEVSEKLNALIEEVTRSPFEGTGKPEPLKHELAGWWSRRITDEHRLVYRIKDGGVEIAQCRFHY